MGVGIKNLLKSLDRRKIPEDITHVDQTFRWKDLRFPNPLEQQSQGVVY